MSTAIITHKDCLNHISPAGHPECAQRLEVILNMLEGSKFDHIDRINGNEASLEQLKLVHSDDYIASIFDNIPTTDNAMGDNFMVDKDTYLSAGSKDAALRAAGATCQAVDLVMEGKYQNIFCAVRPPGHHAEPDQAMGFCLFNSVAIAALYVRKKYFCHRVAIIDIDVHHGNGTQTIVENTKGLFYASTHQLPLYPGTGHIHDKGKGVIINVPLAAGSGSNAFKKAYENRIFPALDEFKADFVFISAGFDAHSNDPLADIKLTEDDFYWVTEEIMKIAHKHAKGRLVSSLEGGYNLVSLAKCVDRHLLALAKDN